MDQRPPTFSITLSIYVSISPFYLFISLQIYLCISVLSGLISDPCAAGLWRLSGAAPTTSAKVHASTNTLRFI